MKLQRRLILGLVLLAWFYRQPLLADPASEENPYAPIAARNVFGLQPLATNAPANSMPDARLPKITPNGIMTIFGRPQVLFKVAVTPIPGQSGPTERSYIMSEGDRQDDMGVQKIDEKSCIITFNNHGVIQELPLLSGNASGGNLASGSVVGSSMTPAPQRSPIFGSRLSRLNRLHRNNSNMQNAGPDLSAVDAFNGVAPGPVSAGEKANPIAAQPSDGSQPVNDRENGNPAALINQPAEPLPQNVNNAASPAPDSGDASLPPDGGDAPPPPPSDGS